MRQTRVLLAAMAMALTPAVASAHSQKEATTPADGAQLAKTPELIHMVFDDPMRITVLRLRNADGTEMTVERATGLEPSLEFRATPEPLSPGSYTVEWRGLASDGHAMQGSFSFELAD